VTDPNTDDSTAPEPAETAAVPSFAEVSEVNIEVSPTHGAKLHLKGLATPAHLMRLVIPPVFVALGIVCAVALLLADRSRWEAAVVFLLASAVALVSLKAAKRSGRN
jgi:hypothetical protein